ncbi:MAG: SPOR domain-containing protein [Prevotellaceae bacterium]|nr:SPOR domain-containing protein [Prevotellaceae bacterium]MDY6131101.1 SPOR domain-containing protein [Prevotella sp.]
MKQTIVTLLLFLCAASHASAQKFTDHLSKSKQGEGKITVTQSKEIEDLVNGTQKKPSSAVENVVVQSHDKGKASTKDNKNKSIPVAKENGQKTADLTVEKNPAETTAAERYKNNLGEQPEKTTDEELEIPIIDTRKKVMRHSYKVTGYRVQAFSGGNSRSDRIKAEEIKYQLKMAFPEQPIYTHFYSPRWVCRMGNFRSYNEAEKYLKKVRALGLKQACIVKGKISVQY